MLTGLHSLPFTPAGAIAKLDYGVICQPRKRESFLAACYRTNKWGTIAGVGGVAYVAQGVAFTVAYGCQGALLSFILPVFVLAAGMIVTGISVLAWAGFDELKKISRDRQFID